MLFPKPTTYTDLMIPCSVAHRLTYENDQNDMVKEEKVRPRWTQMDPDGPRWTQMDPDGPR